MAAIDFGVLLRLCLFLPVYSPLLSPPLSSPPLSLPPSPSLLLSLWLILVSVSRVSETLGKPIR